VIGMALGSGGVAEPERFATHNDQYHIYDSYFGGTGNYKSMMK
jgi:hypothetical protein